jgi:cysteate synthase
MNKSNYKLQSVASGTVFEDSGWLLDTPGETSPSLVRTIYDKKQLNAGALEKGIYRFKDWLPVDKELIGSASPVTYKSEGLAKVLGMANLYITVSGYWPEKGVFMETCSFKETEAFSVCARSGQKEGSVLVVASAGNTARAFARVCSENQIPLLICIPEDNLDALWFTAPLNDCVKAIVCKSGGDYFDAIHLSNLVVKSPKFYAEGGAKNIARRDGMGTTVLSAVTTIGRIPDYYFQAIGSGTGAIAAWEANLRLLEDGRFGNTMMKLMVSQNLPFVPIYDAWKAGSRQLLPMDDGLAREQAGEIDAKVLSNRRPPYAIVGGLFDALQATGGDVLAVTNDEARKAAALFEQTEGIDIHPAAAVAVASLINEMDKKSIDPESVVMLNITGGGEKRFKTGHQLLYLKPSFVFDLNPDEQEVIWRCEELFEDIFI